MPDKPPFCSETTFLLGLAQGLQEQNKVCFNLLCELMQNRQGGRQDTLQVLEKLHSLTLEAVLEVAEALQGKGCTCSVSAKGAKTLEMVGRR